VTDQPESHSTQPVPAGTEALAAAPPSAATDGAGNPPSDRPELAIGAAFAGGFLLAQILRRLAH
jgi:hypothetical protein